MNAVLPIVILTSFLQTALDITLFVGLSILSLAVVYLWLVPLLSVFARSDDGNESEPMSFLILVPAHNEEEGIASTLSSLSKLEHSESSRVVVIADNCTDGTAEIARARGVTVIERNDPEHRGKGYALRYALDRSEPGEYDAVVIVDADTRVDCNVLTAMSESFSAGAGAVQVSNQLSALGHSAKSHLQEMANQAENVLFYYARSRLGLGVLLRGTGMAVRTDVLKEHRWDSYSITEDVDYSLSLLRRGVKILFTRKAAVHSQAATTFSGSFDQKQRWAAGTFNLISDNMIPLLKSGLSLKRLDLIELAFSLLLLSRPTLIMIVIVILGFSFWASESFQAIFLRWSLVLILGLFLYLVSGILFVTDKGKCLLSLFLVPVYGLWLVGVQVIALLRRRKLGWVRTRREDS